MSLEQALKKTSISDPDSLQELAVSLFRRGYGPSKIPGYYMVRVLDTVSDKEDNFLISTDEMDEEGLRDLNAIDSDLLNRLFGPEAREDLTSVRVPSLLPYIRVMARLFPEEFQKIPHISEEDLDGVHQVRGLWSEKPSKYDVEFPRILLETFIIPR